MKKSILLLPSLVLLSFSYCNSQSLEANDKEAYVIPSFESAGIYWKTSESEAGNVRYKEVGEESWIDGLEMVYDPRDEEYRGSIINLKPDTEYNIEIFTSSAEEQLKFKTRTDDFPIGKVTFLPEKSDETFVITESGTSDAYHLVTVQDDSKSVLDLKNVYDHGIEINADYVIVRGVEIRNAKIHGIIIRESRNNIVIEQSYITFWGRPGGPKVYGNLEGSSDSAIWAEEGAYNLTIQRNLLADPRGGSNDWTTGHPGGPQGISFRQSRGGNIIRYNDITASEGHGFNDAIGGGSNFSFVGNMNRDSDIYGNFIRDSWDNGIEIEGANMNVRVWGNYIDKYYAGIATAPTSKGPIYMFRNVFGESRAGKRDTRGGALFKTGEREPYAGGRRYYFHNTTLQPNGATHVFSSHPHPNSITRNNIFDVSGRLATSTESDPASDYDYDYFTGIMKGTAQEENAINSSSTPAGTDIFISSNNLEFYLSSTINRITWGSIPYSFGADTVNITDPIVQVKNPLRNSGALIPGFNDNYKGDGPDIGAFEFGNAPLEFGRRAYLRYNEGWAPWEIH